MEFGHPIRPPASPTELLDLSPGDFERWCADALERHGYGSATVTHKGPNGGDGGVDVFLQKSDGRLAYAVQCKRWSSRPRSGLMHIIRELSGSMTRFGAERGLLIITVPATRFEKREAMALDINVIDAERLPSLLSADRQQHPACRESNVFHLHEQSVRRDRWVATSVRGVVIGIAVILSLTVVYHFRQFTVGVVGLAIIASMQGRPRASWPKRRGKYHRRWRRRN